MIFVETFRDLWRLFGNRDRWVAAILVGMLSLSGSFEIAGMMFLFGYIHALGGAAVNGLGVGAAAHGGLNGISSIFDFFAGELDGPAYALTAGAVLVAVFLAKNVLWLLSSFGLLRFAMKRYESTAAELFDGYQQMPLEQARARGTIEPNHTLSTMIDVFRDAFIPLLQSCADVAIILAMIVALFWVIDPVLVIGSGVVLGTTALAFLALTRRMTASLSKRLRKSRETLNAVTNEALRGLLEVRLAGRQSIMRERFCLAAGEFALADRRARGLGMAPRALNELVLATGIVLAAVWFSDGNGGLSAALPTLAVLGFAGLRVTAAMARFTQALQFMRQTDESRRMLIAELERSVPHLLGEADGPARSYRDLEEGFPSGAHLSLVHEIAVEKVRFRYPDASKAAISDASLRIPAGSFTAFCGPSGGGKSTLALIIMGLLRPQGGSVTCDGHDVQRHLTEWYGQIGYVGQAPFMAPRSLRENVAIGLPVEQIDDAAVWRALEAAAIADLFRSRPEGLDTMLGEDGAMLSGGQRQRVAIARALYGDPKVLVFDEATAALDTATEREVTAAISRLKGSRTIISIAHRLTTIRQADKIYYVDAGKVHASGTYEELEDTFEPFRNLAGSSMVY